MRLIRESKALKIARQVLKQRAKDEAVNHIMRRIFSKLDEEETHFLSFLLETKRVRNHAKRNVFFMAFGGLLTASAYWTVLQFL